MTGGCNQTDQRHTSVSPWLGRELAMEGHTDLVGYLIYKGASVNATNDVGNTHTGHTAPYAVSRVCWNCSAGHGRIERKPIGYASRF